MGCGWNLRGCRAGMRDGRRKPGLARYLPGDYHQRIVIVFGDFHCVRPLLTVFPFSFFLIFFQLFSMVSIVSGSPEPAWPIHLHNFFLPQGVSSGSCPHSRVSSMVGNVIKYIYICIVHRGMPLFLLCVSCVCAQG